jgi:hypothetical protein
VFAVLTLGVLLHLRRPSHDDTPHDTVASTPAVGPDPLALDGTELGPLIERVRAERDLAARARLAATEVHRRRSAALVTDDAPTPLPRTPDLVWRVLPASQEAVTELDIACLMTAVLRAAGEASVSVAERTAPSRADEPTDASGTRGSYVVVVGDHVIEPFDGSLIGSASVRHRVLSPAALSGARAVQEALALAEAGQAGDRATQRATAAVDAWPDAPTALAARARVWLLVGASGAAPLAERDLRAAVSMRDDPALHLSLARLALVGGDLAGAARATQRAARYAPAWGSAAVALHALAPVLAQLDAGTIDACGLLRNARAPWTDHAYTLCRPTVSDVARTEAARRLLEGSRDPLRVAYALTKLPVREARARIERMGAHDRREATAWLLLMGGPLPEGDGGVVGAP